MPKQPVYEYAAYKGDELLAIGTARELAKELGVKHRTIKYYVSNAHRKRIEEYKKKGKGNWMVVENIGRIDEFDEE